MKIIAALLNHGLIAKPARNSITALGIAISLAGCAATPNWPDGIPPSRDEAVRTGPPAIEKNIATHVQQFALMALFAKTVYRLDILDDKTRSSQQACEYLVHPKHRDVLLDMPRDADGGGWSRWTLPGSCYGGGGLYFETYVHQNTQGNIDKAVIAIRGTENSSPSEIRHDWGANLSGVVPSVAGEYGQARSLIRPIIDELAKNPSPYNPNQPIEIYLTGHSLGGGIAQYLAYSFYPKIKATFTFDTSPVTHWMQLPDEEKNSYPVIHRIYMNGEFLSYLRDVTARFNNRRFNRTDYEFFFVKQGAINAHSMSHLTCQFAARVKEPGTEHPYSHENATATLNSPVLCLNEVRALIPQDLLENR